MGSRVWGACSLVAAALAAVVVTASCQTHQFYPMGPQAIGIGNTIIQVEGKALPPNIMLVVDKSGSMTQSVTGTGLACTIDGTVGATYDPRSTNPCKWNDLIAVFADPTTGFLTTSQGLGRFGLAAFPSSTGQCDTGSVLVPIGDDAQPIRDQLLNRLTPGGGTPSAASLLEAGKDSALVSAEPNRKRFAMLLTDGLPNCNSANAAKCAQCRADALSCSAVDGCRPTEVPGTCLRTPFDGASCLDEDALVTAVSQLSAKGIGTFVIGFGKDTSGGDASRVLTRAAVAGGYPRQGAAEQYYQANSVDELKTFLEEILKKFPCTFELPNPVSDKMLVQVSISDSSSDTTTDLVQNTDWQFPSATALGEIQILGDWCTTIQGADPNRYAILVKTVGAL
ncbi:MAG: hypothetical protein QM765_05065 [Myxococcales bacterium]